ncbi:MAG: OmpA family protein [Acidovorax sp.]|uniref:OmpA family protein n=1 Tax=Acidovorax sp. TaxID=1872122 RepID=UPI0039E4F614
MTIKPPSLIALVLAAASLCAATPALAGHSNPIDPVSNPNELVFTDVNMEIPDYRELFVRDGAVQGVNHFRDVVPGMPQEQALAKFGKPLAESDGSRGREWDYNFKFVLDRSGHYVVCQYKLVFDPQRQVREQVWRRRQCQQWAQAVPAPVPVAAPAPVVLPIRSVNFDFDKAAGREDALAILDADVAVLLQAPQMRVSIEGHTDLCGSMASNQALSERRAKMVYDYLISKGVPAAQLVGPTGYGETRPLVHTPQTAPGCRSETNRRTELNVISGG